MTGHDEAELLAIARQAAEAAAAELMSRFGAAQRYVRTKSGPTDLVSEADVAAEEAIRAVLARRRPGDAVLGEEGGTTGDPGAPGGLRWVVDPLDGTINFLFGIPAFAVSVACEDAEGALAAVVLDPVRREHFAAVRGEPARLDGDTIAASARTDLATALVATGFGYDAAVRARQAEVVARLLPRVRDIRRVGSAALDLCWAACGRFDAYYERGVQAWDIAAGALIARCAGLDVRRLDGADGESQPEGILAAPAALIEPLWELVEG